jgi:hypothetical protein
MTYDYDDWYEEKAPCLTESSPPWHSRFFNTLRNALTAVTSRAMLPLIVLSCVAAALGFASGCGRTVLIPEAAVLRVARDVKGHVYSWNEADQEWQMSARQIAYPEGWYIVPPSYVEEDEPLGGVVGATMPQLGARR